MTTWCPNSLHISTVTCIQYIPGVQEVEMYTVWYVGNCCCACYYVKRLQMGLGLVPN